MKKIIYILILAFISIYASTQNNESKSVFLESKLIKELNLSDSQTDDLIKLFSKQNELVKLYRSLPADSTKLKFETRKEIKALSEHINSKLTKDQQAKIKKNVEARNGKK
ncbi:MAG: hypothetical protein JW870_15470 [Candidatus Delongbacteria bacterium]|nr:hypothetical protein [Candidatus Delongbacteria bacterium]MBN2817780.1 hypothetical protein [Bacteroidales bacterium]